MKISVALCTYNGERFLSEQLKSILNQTVPVTEIIVCDDGSTDNTIIILKQFEKTYLGVFKININTENIGVIKNFEKAISLCSGDIIFFADQDDVWESNKVEKCVCFFQNEPGIFGVFTNAQMIEESGQSTNKTFWQLLGFDDLKKELQTKDVFRFMLFYGNMVAGCCMAVTREALSLVFPFKQIENMWHDEWIALKLAEYNKIYFLDEPLIKYRMHNDQQTKWLWQDREEKNRKRSSFIRKQADLYPQDYYKHWKRRASVIEKLSANGLLIDDLFLKEIQQERKKGLLIYFRKKFLFKRKWTLVKLWLKGEENISFWNIIKD